MGKEKNKKAENKQDKKIAANKKEKSLTETSKKEGKVKETFNKFIDVLNKKWLVNGTTTILLVLIILAIYLGVTKLLDNVTLPEFDMTTDKIYSLSEETKTKVGALEKDITITLINYGSDETTKSTVKKYKTVSDKITIDEIDDITSRSDIMEKYSITSSDTLIVIACGDKESTLSSSDLYTYDYSTYEQIDITEEAITNAIVDVTSDVKPKVYFMSNHITYQSSYYATLTDSLKADANEVETIDLFANGGVPEDCDLLIITTLKEDLTEAERDSIKNYINNGGELMLLCGANLNGTALPNFQEILDLYGISIQDGVIFEGNSSNMLSGYPDIIVENINANSTTKNVDMNLNVALIDAAAINVTSDSDKIAELGVEYETLATTSSSSFIRTNLNLQSASRTSSDSENSSYTVGVLATKTISDDVTSKLVLYSNELFTMDMPMQIGNYSYYAVDLYNNQDVVANAVSYLNEREDTITIRKNYDSVTYTVTQAQNNVIMAIIFITPLVIIVAGIVIWIVRKRTNR